MKTVRPKTNDAVISSDTPAEPRVGIFWLFKGNLVIDSTPLSCAEPYGDCVTHPRGHLEVWTAFQRRSEVPAEVEYEEPPRGRVLFHRRRDRFFLLADRCILQSADIPQRIMAEMHLPNSNTETETDAHYRCSICLYGRSPMDDLF